MASVIYIKETIENFGFKTLKTSSPKTRNLRFLEFKHALKLNLLTKAPTLPSDTQRN